MAKAHSQRPGNTCLVFDLSEVLIAGLLGVEEKLAPAAGVLERDILAALGGEGLRELCCGEVTEDAYLQNVLDESQWPVTAEKLKRHIRANFHWKIGGMKELVVSLAQRHRLALYSDHAREWIEYILQIHPFLGAFESKVFSFELGLTKGMPGAFDKMLKRLGLDGDGECIYVDDNPTNVRHASDAGMQGLLFSSAGTLAAALRGLGVAVP
jgi:FMN phosphatase YigB (HAD superfamily)